MLTIPAPRSTAVRRGALAAAIALAVAASACSREDPTAPRAYTVSGHVKLTGFLVDDGGVFAGTRVVGDASGIVVELVYGSRVVARTTTAGGRYTFRGIAPGAYEARTSVLGALADTTERLTVVNVDLAVADTLRLASLGDLVAVPNPIAPMTHLWFAMPATRPATIEVRDLGGRRVRTLWEDTLPAGWTSVAWDSRDEAGAVASDPIYWATFESGSDRRAHLMFR